MPPYRLKVRLGDSVETLGYRNRGRMIADATKYTERGYIVSYLED